MFLASKFQKSAAGARKFWHLSIMASDASGGAPGKERKYLGHTSTCGAKREPAPQLQNPPPSVAASIFLTSMKRLLLLVSLSLGAPLQAQNALAPRPAPVLQTDAATILTPDFIRSCTYIAHGTLSLKKSGAQTLGGLVYGQHEPLKGLGDLELLGFGLGDASAWKSGDKAIFFTRYSSAQKRAVIVGRLPATAANIARVKALVAQTPDFEISFATDKERYALGEAVKVSWRFKNVSPLARSLFVGPSALSISLVHDNRATSSEDEKLRQGPRFVQVQPGQSWAYERTFDGTFPVGTLELSWTYDPYQALERSAALPESIVLLRQESTLPVTILPARQAQVQALDVGIKSPRWNEQLAAAQKLLQSDAPADWKKLEPLASHPMRELREIAEKALARGGAFPPALKALFYASTPIEAANFPQGSREGNGDFALALLARAAVEEEARDRGFKGPQPAAAGGERNYPPLDFNGDPRIGDLLAARLRRGKPMEGGVNNALTLLSLAGLQDEVQDTEKPVPDALRAKVLAAWDARRAEVKSPFTQAHLDAEIALARQIHYNNFKTGPFYAEVAALID